MILKTKDNVVTNAIHRIDSSRATRTHSTNTHCIEQMEADRDEEAYSQWQPGLELEESNWLEDYNYIRPGESSIRDEAYRNWWYETIHPRPYGLGQAIEYWNNRRRQLQ